MMFASLGECAELCPLLPRHAIELYGCVANARTHLAEWTVVASRVTDVASARELLERFAEPPHYFGIWLNGHLVGATLFRTFDVQSGTCELGAWLIPAAERRGLVTKAFRQLIDWARREHGMTRIELHASPNNTRGRAIAVRLGMILDTVIHDAITINGNRHDSEVWVIDTRE